MECKGRQQRLGMDSSWPDLELLVQVLFDVEIVVNPDLVSSHYATDTRR